MANRFEDIAVFREQLFTLGRDHLRGQYFLSTPISGAVLAAEYEAYFRITDAEFATYIADPAAASPFLEACRDHRHGDRLLDQSQVMALKSTSTD